MHNDDTNNKISALKQMTECFLQFKSHFMRAIIVVWRMLFVIYSFICLFVHLKSETFHEL